jgi:hypothetical protein
VILLLFSLFIVQARVADSVLPSLTYSHACSTTIEMRNLGERAVDARVEPHRESGSLVALVEQPGLDVHLSVGEQKVFRLQLPEATENAWAEVHEFVPNRGLSPVLAVTGQTTCLVGEQVRSAVREVAQVLRNPWFDGDFGEMAGARITVVNTSGTVAIVSGCYSGGTLIANPNVPGGATLKPLCSYRFREQIPPFSARSFATVRDGSSHFSLHAAGTGIALQLSRLLDAGTHLYRVDSSINFGGNFGGEPDRW